MKNNYFRFNYIFTMKYVNFTISPLISFLSLRSFWILITRASGYRLRDNLSICHPWEQHWSSTFNDGCSRFHFERCWSWWMQSLCLRFHNDWHIRWTSYQRFSRLVLVLGYDGSGRTPIDSPHSQLMCRCQRIEIVVVRIHWIAVHRFCGRCRWPALPILPTPPKYLWARGGE